MVTVSKIAALVEMVQRELRALADPEKADPMAAYLKTDMPFYGVQKPLRLPLYRDIKQRFELSSRREYEASVLALWSLDHR